MAVREAAKEVGVGLAWGSPGIMATILNFLGSLDLSKTLTAVTILYTTALFLRQLPKLYGCAACFIRNKTCTKQCKD